MKFCLRFFENLSRKFKFSYDLKTTCTLNEDFLHLRHKSLNYYYYYYYYYYTCFG